MLLTHISHKSANHIVTLNGKWIWLKPCGFSTSYDSNDLKLKSTSLKVVKVEKNWSGTFITFFMLCHIRGMPYANIGSAFQIQHLIDVHIQYAFVWNVHASGITFYFLSLKRQTGKNYKKTCHAYHFDIDGMGLHAVGWIYSLCCLSGGTVGSLG